MAGNVYWITGLSGSGKTTLGTALVERIRKHTEKVILLDGDTMREYICKDLGYSIDERTACAMRYSELCAMLAKQDFIIVCCTISMFDSVREHNREQIENYIEVYVKVTDRTLQERDQKGMYSQGVNDMMGVDQQCELPKHPDYTFDNDAGDVEVFVENLLQKCGY